jgi:MGT family glycosyltransferase
MARIACTTMDGGGNVSVFRGLRDELVARGHDVRLTVGPWGGDVDLDGDVVIVDFMLRGDVHDAVAAAEVPTVALVHTLWAFAPSFDGGMFPAGFLDQLARFDRILVCTLPELDGSSEVPDNVRFVGPPFEAAAVEPWTPPAGPLVVVSMGTTDMGEGPVLQKVLDACAGIEAHVIATVGAHLDPSSFAVPANAEVVPLRPHAGLLPPADLFVGHAGHGGIMAALRHGVPIVCVPLSRDQPTNAARVAAVGAGVTVDTGAPLAALRGTIDAALRDGELRANAARLAADIAALDGAPADAVESLLP